MNATFQFIRLQAFALLALTRFMTATLAQEVLMPDAGLNAAVREALQRPNGPLTQQDLLGLTNLFAVSRNISNLQGLSAAHNLRSLQLDDNRITDISPANELTGLDSLVLLDLSGNPITHLTLPDGMTNLTRLRIEVGSLTNLTLSPGLTGLTELRLGFNELPSLALPADMTNLSVISVYNNQLTNLVLPSNLTSLTQLVLDGNRLSSLTLPAGLGKLNALVLGSNQLTNFILAAGLTNLSVLRLNDNPLTDLTLPADLNQVILLHLPGNRLRSLTLPEGLTNLSTLVVSGNPLTNITLPPDMARLFEFFLDGNSLETFVLPEPLAATGLASVVDSLRRQGVPVFTYPLSPQLLRPRTVVGAFQFGITGPPGAYSVLSSTNGADWSVLGAATNLLGAINFTDVTANASPRTFYRARRLVPPKDMVFVSPGTFTMGSPTNDPRREIFEGPQSTVTLTRGFWIGRHEVTQGEYLAVTGGNPSNFPGDLTRPVSSVTWHDATNYCAKLTGSELAAGRLLPGMRYRLPTEAEWECAARAGTSTQFSYGDDPDYASLPSFAWFLDLSNPILTVRPVGQKLPNPWGLYDMHGNVWEWCQDWYGDQVGGLQTDPTGPASNRNGNKVMRGGAYDYPYSSCRSASRLFFHAILPDSDLGFRVVLAADP